MNTNTNHINPPEMSTHRSYAEFGEERNSELLEKFDKLLAESPMGTPVINLFQRLVALPARRFYVSELRAMRVIGAMRRGIAPGGCTRTRRRMYGEIMRRVDLLMTGGRHLAFADAVVEAVNSPAPEMYMEVSSAKVTVYALLRRRRTERRRQRLMKTPRPDTEGGRV